MSDAVDDADKPHLIVTGDVVKGFEFVGPFPTLADAVEWGRLNTDKIGTYEWTTAPLTAPTPDAALIAGRASAAIRTHS